MRRDELPHYYLDKRGEIVTRLNYGNDHYDFGIESLIDAPFDRSVALIDRDGIIIKKASKNRYIAGVEDIILIEGATDAIRYLNNKNITVAIVSNQQAIANGIVTPYQFYRTNIKIQHELKRGGAQLDGVFFCPHFGSSNGPSWHRDLCSCRKPRPGLLNLAVQVCGADKSKTLFFGDFESNIEAAKKAGLTAVYIATKHDEYEEQRKLIKERHPEVFEKKQYHSLLEAVRKIA